VCLKPKKDPAEDAKSTAPAGTTGSAKSTAPAGTTGSA
jgi:hypothetical protein